jgi:hypothetical protein
VTRRDGDRSRTAAALVYFLLVSVWLTWPLLPRMATALSSSPDSLLNAWALGWSFHILPLHPLQLFDANIFAPRPDTLAYSEHLFGIVILVWPVFLLTSNLVLSYNTALLASFVLSGLGAYLLVRELTSNRWAAVAAGTIFLAAPYRFGHLLQIQLLATEWFPFVFFCLLRFLRQGRLRQLAGVVVFSLLQILSCNYYAVYLALAVGLFGVALVVCGRALLSARTVALLLSGAAVVSAASLPFVLPYERNRERGFYRRYEDVAHFSASLLDYLTPSSFNRAPHFRLLPSEPRSEKALFMGFAALALAGIGALSWRGRLRDRPDRVFFAFAVLLGVSALLLSLGPETRWGDGDAVLPLPYRLFYRWVPGFGGMRVPARLSVLALLAVAMLAGIGASVLLERARAGGRERERWAAIALLLVLLFEYRTYSLDRALPEAPEIPAVHRFLAEAPGSGAVLVLPIHEGEEIARESLYMYYSTAHFRPLVNGYSGWWPNDYWELVGRLRTFPTARTLRFLLERAPVDTLVVHYDRIPGQARRALEEGMERYHDRMPVLLRVGDDVVYEIRR